MRFIPTNKSKLEMMGRTGQLAAFLMQKKSRAALKTALTEYVQIARENISCLQCGAKQAERKIIWHHPDGDGHLGRVDDLVSALATIEKIDAEISRCVPLCKTCHAREHGQKVHRYRVYKVMEVA